MWVPFMTVLFVTSGFAMFAAGAASMWLLIQRAESR